MIPSKVQHKSDGPWHPWTNGNVDTDQLTVAKQLGEPSYVNGCVVFGFKMDDGREWNCKKGWK